LKSVVIVGMLAVSASSLWQNARRETNSHASAKRGVDQYNYGHYEPAVKSFADAASLHPAPQNSFNLGTAQIAAGKRTEGSMTLEKAMSDPAFRAETLYNRGNSALASKAYEHAVRDYSAALRLRPGDGQAKRNLEIALNELQSMQRSGGSQSQQKPGAPQQQDKQKSQSEQRKDENGEDADTEALLRSVQQQEQEELARMKKARGESARIGW
jgi:Ca-activated chloride channel family protein